MTRPRRRLARTGSSAAVLAASLTLGACAVPLLVGGGDGAGGDRAGREGADAGASEDSRVPDPGADPSIYASLDEVEAATVQIVAQGTFVDPAEGEFANAVGSGSGFVVDPEGIVVTNNHVVTGAASLQVVVGGATDDPVNAVVLGVSECSDLAVIDLEGDGYPTLDWSDEVPAAGLEVYAAGFPLGDPEFTLTSGIVSKADADGESPWASVDSVLEHDATINPGNSGGPLVDPSGRVVGVNYAGNPDTRQQFAIGADEAQEVVETLRGEEDATSIGINGQALLADDGSSGIWVASVESGTPADSVGIRPGDILTRLENIDVATDGTMREYCEVLRSRRPTDVLAVQVVRPETEQVLEGRLNGDPLVPVTSFAQELGGDGTAGEDGAPADAYSEYVLIRDDTGAIEVEVPAEWSDVQGAPTLVDGTTTAVDVRASTDLSVLVGGWTVPGIVLNASSALAATTTPEGLLDLYLAANTDCAYVGREVYQDQIYTGSYDLYGPCGGEETVYVIMSATPADGSHVLLLQLQAIDDRDLEAVDRVLRSFRVVGTV